MVAISGRLLPNNECKFRPARQSDGSCDVTKYGRDVRVTDSFGRPGDLHFGEALSQQTEENKGNWVWTQMRNGLLPLKDGITVLDWAIRYFMDEGFGNLAYEFATTLESVDRCVLKVEVLAPSEPNCQSLQDGAVIEPIITPII